MDGPTNCSTNCTELCVSGVSMWIEIIAEFLVHRISSLEMTGSLAAVDRAMTRAERAKLEVIRIKTGIG